MQFMMAIQVSSLLLALIDAQSTFGSRKNVVIVSRQLKEDLVNRAMNISGPAAVPKPSEGPLPTEFELFDPPNLYLYHDYVSQGLPKFMTDVELSTGTQRVIFILHWSVRYFLGHSPRPGDAPMTLGCAEPLLCL
uniref:Uncharacterized protein n=1 Tax=Lygus hesperus TaxID=30085 RepID=A0A0K8TE72_LYGHE